MVYFLLACGEVSAPECVDDADCDGVAVCTEAQSCREVQCVESIQCPLGTFCQFNTCFTGCAETSDCSPGNVCDVARNQCVQSACTDSEIDCRLGEVCGEDGVCRVPSGLCEPCAADWGSACFNTHNGECAYSGNDYACFTTCDPQAPAGGPRGFTCLEFEGGHIWYGVCADVETSP